MVPIGQCVCVCAKTGHKETDTCVKTTVANSGTAEGNVAKYKKGSASFLWSYLVCSLASQMRVLTATSTADDVLLLLYKLSSPRNSFIPSASQRWTWNQRRWLFSQTRSNLNSPSLTGSSANLKNDQNPQKQHNSRLTDPFVFPNALFLWITSLVRNGRRVRQDTCVYFLLCYGSHIMFSKPLVQSTNRLSNCNHDELGWKESNLT